jgi:hypothetical protein
MAIHHGRDGQGLEVCIHVSGAERPKAGPEITGVKRRGLRSVLGGPRVTKDARVVVQESWMCPASRGGMGLLPCKWCWGAVGGGRWAGHDLDYSQEERLGSRPGHHLERIARQETQV